MCDDHQENISRCSCRSGRMSRFLIPAILLLLAEKPSHGYELTERYSEMGFSGSDSDPGSIYRTLKTLESEGFIESRWETGGSGPAKKIYSITPEGTEMLTSWSAELKKRKKTLELFLSRYNNLNFSDSTNNS
ncbi:MAG: PadR family transcriptional regulator [Candidatus Humimicrobiaceae bacterium]